MLKIIMMSLTIFFLSGCRSYERRLTCEQINNHQIPTVEFCDISFEFNRCRCRQFDMNKWESIGDAQDFPLLHCEGIAGVNLKDIASDVRPHVKALAQLKENLCGKN